MWRGLILAAVMAVVMVGCDEVEEKQRDLYQDSERARVTTLDKAQKLHPLPVNENFPLREALVEFTKRQDQVNHPWYIYILGENGNPIGYFVGKTYPQNICNFLSSTVDDLPSLDGIYYGGSGAKGTCDAWFFFDVTTDAMQVISGLPYFVSDRPLVLNVQPIKVADGR